MKHIMPKFKKKLFQSVNKMKIYIYMNHPITGKLYLEENLVTMKPQEKKYRQFYLKTKG